MKTLRYFMMSALMLVAGAMYAQNATITIDPNTDKGTCDSSNPGADQVTKDGVTIAVSNGCMNLQDQYRCYKSATFKVTSTVGNITKVQVQCTASGEEKYGPGCFTDPSVGNYAFEGNVGTWTGDAAEFTLTSSTNQVRMSKVVVTIGAGSGEGDITPDPEPTVEQKSIAEAIAIGQALEQGKTTDYDIIVEGFIIADPSWTPYYNEKDKPESGIKNYNLNINIAETADAAEGLLVYNVWNLDGTYFTTEDADVAKGVKVKIQGKMTNYKGTIELTKGKFLAIGDKVAGVAAVKNVKAQNGVMYNLAGQVVNKGYKGLVIMNGRKFMNK